MAGLQVHGREPGTGRESGAVWSHRDSPMGIQPSAKEPSSFLLSMAIPGTSKIWPKIWYSNVQYLHFRILEISHWYYSFLSIWLNLSFWACWLPDVASPFPEPSGASHENVESKSCQGKHGRHGPGNHQGKWVPVVFGMMNQQEHACCFLSVSGRVFQRRWKNDVQKGECVSSVCSPLVSTIIRISK